jgi:hypothetical protein
MSGLCYLTGGLDYLYISENELKHTNPGGIVNLFFITLQDLICFVRSKNTLVTTKVK